jgi:branched-chain amino acid transport system permease protein
VFASVLLSEFTKAWLLYLGLVFLFMVMFAPGGVASLVMMNLRVVKYGLFKPFWALYAGLVATGALLVVGAAALVEMVYHIQLNSALGPEVAFAGLTLDTSSTGSWLGAAALALAGLGLLEWVRRRFARAWSAAQEQIEAENKRRAVA